MDQRVGVHVGSKKVRGVLWDGAAVVRDSKRGNGVESLADLVDAVAETVDRCAEEAEISGVGLALPAVVHPDTGVVLACDASPWLVGEAVCDAVSQRLQVPVRADSEAHCAVWADYLAGDEERRRLPTLGLTPTLHGGAVFIIDGELLRGDEGYGMNFGSLLQRISGEPDAADGSFTMATLIRRLADKHGLRLKKKDPVAEVCKKAAKGSTRAAAVLEEAGAPIGFLVRSMRKSLELAETDPFFVLHADPCEEAIEFLMPVAVSAACYLRQHSSVPGKLACAVGAAQL